MKKKQAVYTRLDPKMLKKLDTIAVYLGRSRSNTVAQAVKELVDTYLTDGKLVLNKSGR